MKYKPEWGRANLMALAAFRYCLGRRTYIVSDCVEWLERYWDEIDAHTKKLIVEETREAIEKGESGMEMDVACWKRIANKT